ncbi:RagB/SusD family nutrient uptake outer membrane protein [Sphingobacterium sp.]|uniref:RagB/SusD family nutrient uptake outer membrane protein n=1 Tax=Sphingobacterium sp. TaxID=341027 RepID=UPI0028A247B8|nr:RagB/SusD family nutrient uptake outer membrane protein [Sphingobacterium sp.]
MKRHFTYIIALLLASSAALMTQSCKDNFFELVDHGGLDARIWDNEGAIEYYLAGTYSMIMPTHPHEITTNEMQMHYASDENYFSGTNAPSKKVLGLSGEITLNDVKYIATKYQGTNVGDNRYFDIARCNNAIAYIPTGTLSTEVKKKFLGQFYALRAMVYFELTRLYGGVPLVLDPQNPDALQLSGRASAKTCFEQIVADLDSAMVNLDGLAWDDATGRGKFTKAAAATMKAKALLYWASPQFNPTDNPAHPYDAQRWEIAFKANKEAYDLCKALGRDLLPNYNEIFLKEGTANTEAVIVRSYSSISEKRFTRVEQFSRPSSEGGSPQDYYVATTQLLHAYRMKDGTLANSNNALYDDALFWKNRDPRFKNTIVYNGAEWPLSGKTGRKQWNYTNAAKETSIKSFYCKKFVNPTLSSSAVGVANDLGGNGMDWIEIRFAEVMLNYAETANETGNLALAKDLVRSIRQRAGIEQGNYDYGLSLASNTVQMRDLIMNERQIEFAFEGKRYHDLRRTRRMHTLEGTIQTYLFETKSDALKKILESANTAGILHRETLDMNNRDTVLNYFKYPYNLRTESSNGAFAFRDYYYFYPLPNTFMNSSPLLEQTIGYEGGTFDPLKD